MRLCALGWLTDNNSAAQMLLLQSSHSFSGLKPPTELRGNDRCERTFPTHGVSVIGLKFAVSELFGIKRTTACFQACVTVADDQHAL